MSTTYAVGQRLTAAMIQSLADYTINRPLVRLTQAAAQSISDNTHTALTFGTGSTLIDTHGYHSESTNNSRVTPLLAGVYAVSGGYSTSARTDYASLQASIRLNGTNLASDNKMGPNATSANREVVVGPVFVQMNGTTDYVEIAGYQDNVANVAVNTNVSGSSASSLQVEFLRPA